MNAHFPSIGRLRWPLVAAVAVTSALVGALPVVAVTAATADALGSAQAQATALAQKITDEQNTVDQLSEQYDGARYHLTQVQTQVAAARTGLSQADAQWRQISARVVQEAVRAYTQGGFGGESVPTGSVDPVVAESYFTLATQSQNDALDQLRATRQSLTNQEAVLARAETESRNALAAVNARRQQVARAQEQAQATLGSVKGQIAALVAAAQARQQAAQRAALQAQYNAELARQRAEATSTTVATAKTTVTTGRSTLALAPSRSAAPGPAAAPVTVGRPAPAAFGRPASTAVVSQAPTSAPAPIFTAAPTVPPVTAPHTLPAPPPTSPVPTSPPTAPPPPPPPPPPPRSSSVAATAVAVALAQVGKPYQWGAAGPSSFDCSGLVQFAFGAAGVYLPHYTVAQWDDTTHVPLSDMQPGDLVFFYSDFHHVGIYLGNGMMVDAPHTGAFVRVESIAWFGPIAGVGRVG